MKHLFFALLSSFLLAGGVLAKEAPKAKEALSKVDAPKRAPLIRVGPKNYAKEVLAPRTGKVVVVSFWATWCLPCIHELPLLGELGRELASQGVDWVLVNADQATIDDGRIHAFLDRAKVDLPVYVQDDSDAGAFDKVVDPSWKGQLPFMVIYDATGKRFSVLKGGQHEPSLRAAVSEALAHRRGGASKGAKKTR